jgi:hypothetical protein
MWRIAALFSHPDGSARADEVVDPAGLIGSWHNNAELGAIDIALPTRRNGRTPIYMPQRRTNHTLTRCVRIE